MTQLLPATPVLVVIMSRGSLNLTHMILLGPTANYVVADLSDNGVSLKHGRNFTEVAAAVLCPVVVCMHPVHLNCDAWLNLLVWRALSAPTCWASQLCERTLPLLLSCILHAC